MPRITARYLENNFLEAIFYLKQPVEAKVYYQPMPEAPVQPKQNDWNFQWENFYDDSLFLFKEWIFPHTLETFRGKSVVDCGCGGGQHINFVAPFARRIIGIDLNTTAIAREHTEQHSIVSFVEGDLASVSLPEQHDVVYCIGVLQHTTNPDATFANIKKMVASGGRLMIWCYSKEGNWPNWLILEPLKRCFILKLPKRALLYLATALTALLYPVIYTLYLLPLRFLPYYEYFGNWRKLSFGRNRLNVFDKLNAPITNFITRVQVERWFNQAEFSDIFIDQYKGVSWRASGVKL